MTTVERTVEQDIVAKGLVAPRVTPADVEAHIADEVYFTALNGRNGSGGLTIAPRMETTQALGLLTFCVLVLKNGFTVTGESACASPENFNAEIGKRVARQHAVEKIWPLLGYELRTRLSQG